MSGWNELERICSSRNMSCQISQISQSHGVRKTKIWIKAKEHDQTHGFFIIAHLLVILFEILRFAPRPPFLVIHPIKVAAKSPVGDRTRWMVGTPKNAVFSSELP